MIIVIYFKEKCILKLLCELIFNYSSLYVIVVREKNFLVVMKIEVEDEVEEVFL